MFAKAVETEIPLFFSSGSKSQIVFPSVVLPSLSVAFPRNNIASANEVLPSPPWPIRQMFLILLELNFAMYKSSVIF